MQFNFNPIVTIVSLLCIILFFIVIILKKKLDNTTRQFDSKMRYEKLFEALPAPIFYIDSNKDTVYTNRFFDISFGVNRAKTIQLLSKSLKGSLNQIELAYDNNIQKKVMIFSSHVLDESYEKSGLVGVLFDIDDFKKEITSLLAWKQRYTLAIEGPQYGLWDWKVPENSFYSSSKWKEIMGYESNEKSHNLNSWLSMVDTRDMAKVNEALNIHLKGLSDIFEIEHRIRLSKDIKWISVRGKALFDNEQNAIKMSGLILDISKRKKLEFSLNESKKLFMTYVENLPGLAFIKDEKSKYLYINRYFENFIGFIEWKNKTPVDIFDGKIAKSILENDKKAFFQDKKRHRQVLTNEEGIEKSFEVHKFIIKNENGEKLLCGFGILTEY